MNLFQIIQARWRIEDARTQAGIDLLNAIALGETTEIERMRLLNAELLLRINQTELREAFGN